MLIFTADILSNPGGITPISAAIKPIIKFKIKDIKKVG
jgi:hypothetical protein